MSRFAGDIRPIQKNLPGIRPGESGYRLEKRGFSGTAETQQRYQFTFIQMNINIPDDDPGIIGLRDVFGSQQFQNSFPLR